jgi:hypothetical protein
VDTVVTHRCNPRGLCHHAHTILGAAAAAACKQKWSAFQRCCVRGLSFFAFALENYGYLDTQVMDSMRHVAMAAASTGAVTCGSFVASLHREIIMALVKGSHESIFGQGFNCVPAPRGMLVFREFWCPRLRLSEFFFCALCML